MLLFCEEVLLEDALEDMNNNHKILKSEVEIHKNNTNAVHKNMEQKIRDLEQKIENLEDSHIKDMKNVGQKFKNLEESCSKMGSELMSTRDETQEIKKNYINNIQKEFRNFQIPLLEILDIVMIEMQSMQKEFSKLFTDERKTSIDYQAILKNINSIQNSLDNLKTTINKENENLKNKPFEILPPENNKEQKVSIKPIVKEVTKELPPEKPPKKPVQRIKIKTPIKDDKKPEIKPPEKKPEVKPIEKKPNTKNNNTT